jgi:hypothetical protein
MAKVKTNSRNTQIKLTRHDGAFVFDRGVGVHMLAPPRIRELMDRLRSIPEDDWPDSIDPEDYVFCRLWLTYLEASQEIGAMNPIAL